jgi:hypothetical protein
MPEENNLVSFIKVLKIPEWNDEILNKLMGAFKTSVEKGLVKINGLMNLDQLETKQTFTMNFYEFEGHVIGQLLLSWLIRNNETAEFLYVILDKYTKDIHFSARLTDVVLIDWKYNKDSDVVTIDAIFTCKCEISESVNELAVKNNWFEGMEDK